MTNSSHSAQQFLWNTIVSEQIPEPVSRLLHTGEVSYWDWDIPAESVIVSDSFCTTADSVKNEKKEVITFQDFVDRIHPADREEFQRLIAEIRDNSRQAYDLELRFRNADRSFQWVRSTGAAAARDSQNSALRIIGMHQKIDQQKREGIALQVLNAFTPTGSRKEVLTEYCQAISAVFDSRYVAISQIVQKENRDWVQVIAGWKDEKAIDQHEYPLKGSACAHAANRGIWVTKNKVQDVFPDSDFLKQLQAASYAGIRLHDRHGRPTAILSIVDSTPFDESLDVTTILKLLGSRAESEWQRMEMEQELRRARKTAEQAARTRSEFLANISHEIRNPMTTILGFTELLGSDTEFSSDVIRAADAIESIKKSGQQLLAVINDVLDASKIDSGKMIMAPTVMDPIQIVEETCNSLRSKAIERMIKFKVEYTSDIPAQIISDPQRLGQALRNLVDNAIKFTEQGSVTIAVSYHKSFDFNDMMTFDVIDTGIGLTPKQKEEIETYQPFNQADGSSTRRYGGIGLGLRITSSLASMLGGGIEIVSQKGKGSTFSLSVSAGSLDGVEMLDESRIAERVAQINATSTETPANQNAKRLQGKRILVAEDGKENQKLISYHLEKAGAEVVIAENGKIALDKVGKAEERSQHFHLILMDMQMPELDGYSATRSLREQGYELPVVALTANAMDDDRMKCIVAGCDDYISKPIDTEQLIDTCLQYCESDTELCLAE